MQDPPRILVCRCEKTDVLPEDVTSAVLDGLRESGVAFEVVDDLCGLAAGRSPVLQKYAGRNVRIAACYPRAVKWLLHAAGVENGEVAVMNMRVSRADEVLAGLLADATPEGAHGAEAFGDSAPGGWTPWFPVIDYERCTNCKQCLSFCLFGVFGADSDGIIAVQNPAQCKTNCPACSRVCPNVAIIFPKYDKRPINGDEVREEDLRRGAVKVNVADMMEGDVHAKLRTRNLKARERFSTTGDIAAAEASCSSSTPAAASYVDVEYLRKMREELDIPDEVLAGIGGAGNVPAESTKAVDLTPAAPDAAEPPGCS